MNNLSRGGLHNRKLKPKLIVHHPNLKDPSHKVYMAHSVKRTTVLLDKIKKKYIIHLG